MKDRFQWFQWFVILLLCTNISNATHIRGGEITVERLTCQGLTFRITLTAWVDLGSTVEFGGGELNFNDGSASIVPRVDMILVEARVVGNGFGIVRFQIEHTFPSNGEYAISYLEHNRNGNIINMDNSQETPFYIETWILLDDFQCCNDTPVLLIPPIDDACTGVAFYHNPGAWDADGDSLSYEITIPRKGQETEVDNYRFPNEFGGNTEAGESPPLFGINPETGNVLWDAPGMVGEYNIAFIIKEWRTINNQVVLLSSVIRDMQIIVSECNNDLPKLTIPENKCVEAGTFIKESITATDTNGDNIRIEAFGGPLETSVSPAIFNFIPQEDKSLPANGEFEWQTDCFHVSRQPYQVNFKVSEVGENIPNLVKFDSWNINVLPPAPKGLDVTIKPGRVIQLDWEPYFCPNAEVIQVWRRVDSYDFSTDCVTGIPDFAGYELIAEVGPETTTFNDDNDGNFLDFGALNCYRLIAIFPCGGGESIASAEVCGLIQAEAPVITNVTVDETNQVEGKVTIKWRRPFEINVGSFPPPYFYDLYRADSINGVNFKIIAADLTEIDTVYSDIAINTMDLGYTYYVSLKDANKIPLINSSEASSIKSNTTPLANEIEIRWNANVPWSNNTQRFPMHYIFRDHITADVKEIVLIDSINVNQDGFLYTDTGQSNGEDLIENSIYCYYITTQGAYGNPRIQEPLVNNSQIICGQIEDNSPPCIPILSLEVTDCDQFISSNVGCSFNNYQNRLSWTIPDENECIIEDFEKYDIYFSTNGRDPFNLIASLNAREYIHSNLDSFAGCYYVIAVDKIGNESEPSSTLCNDNCPNYLLPNVFTPNNDGYNDVFNALNIEDNPDLDPTQCPLFVKRVLFTVYNRYGKEVFIYNSGGENGILIGWDGTTINHNELSSGLYFYSAEVLYDVIDLEKQKDILKGWIQILK